MLPVLAIHPSANTNEFDQAIIGVKSLALHADENIRHKDQLATFVPWQAIAYSAMMAGELTMSSFHQPTSSKMGLKLLK